MHHITSGANAGFIGHSDLDSCRSVLADVRLLLDRVSRANPTECRPCLAGALPAVLCVISIAVLLFFSQRGNMATPAAVNPSGKSTPIVTLETKCRFSGVNAQFKEKKRGFVSTAAEEERSGDRPPKPGSTASIPLPPPSRFPHNAAILYSFEGQFVSPSVVVIW